MYIIAGSLCCIVETNTGESNGTLLQYSSLENPMGRGAWWAVVHGVATSRTRLSDFTFTFHFPALEKEMATHPSVLTWRIPGTGEPGGLPSMGSHSVGRDWSDLVAAAAAVIKNPPANAGDVRNTSSIRGSERSPGWGGHMATHSSILAWRIPGTGEPGGLPSVGSHRVGHDWSDLAVANINKLEGNKVTCLRCWRKLLSTQNSISRRKSGMTCK